MIREISLETRRLTVRTLTYRDVNLEYRNWLLNPSVGQFLVDKSAFGGWASLIKYFERTYSDPNVLFLSISLNGFGQIGTLKIYDFDAELKSAYIGIMIGEIQFRKMGLAQEAISVVLEYCVNELDVRHFYAGIDKANLSSIELFRKLGFQTVDDGVVLCKKTFAA